MNYLRYEPMAGECIDQSIRRSIELAHKHNRPVRFRFNDTPMRVSKRLSFRHLCNQWKHMREAAQIKFENSAEGRSRLANRAARICQAQEDTDDWIALLPSIVHDMDKLMQWLRHFSQSTDLIGVVYDRGSVVEQLQAAGYRDNQHAGMGHPPEWFCTRQRLGEYLVGQAINCLLCGMGPHPSLTPRFVAQYESLPFEKTGEMCEPNP